MCQWEGFSCATGPSLEVRSLVTSISVKTANTPLGWTYNQLIVMKWCMKLYQMLYVGHLLVLISLQLYTSGFADSPLYSSFYPSLTHSPLHFTSCNQVFLDDGDVTASEHGNTPIPHMKCRFTSLYESIVALYYWVTPST